MVEGLKARLDAIYEAINHLRSLTQTAEIVEEINRLEKLLENLESSTEFKLEAWDKVQIARQIDRPRGKFYIE